MREDSIQVYQELTPQKDENEDINLRRLKEYIAGDEYCVSSVIIHLAQVTANSRVTPRISLWDKPNEMEEIGKLVYNVATSAGFVDNVWPYLSIVMGSSRDNTTWCSYVLTTIALFEAMKILPFAGEKK